jgi:hypothetical protein
MTRKLFTPEDKIKILTYICACLERRAAFFNSIDRLKKAVLSQV